MQNAHPTHISACHKKTVLLQNFFHFVEPTHKSTSAHQKQQQSSLYHLPYLLIPSVHTTSLLPLLPHYQLNLIFQTATGYISILSSQHPSTMSSPSHLCICGASSAHKIKMHVINISYFIPISICHLMIFSAYISIFIPA